MAQGYLLAESCRLQLWAKRLLKYTVPFGRIVAQQIWPFLTNWKKPVCSFIYTILQSNLEKQRGEVLAWQQSLSHLEEGRWMAAAEWNATLGNGKEAASGKQVTWIAGGVLECLWPRVTRAFMLPPLQSVISTLTSTNVQAELLASGGYTDPHLYRI